MSLPLANTLTTLMMSTAIYLLVVNLIVGLIEGWALRRWFGGTPRAAWWMVAGNYASAWGGMFLLNTALHLWSGDFLGERPIERINALAALSLLCAFGVTVLLEWPFVWVARQREGRSAIKSLGASAIVNAGSYVLLVGWCLGSAYSLPGTARVVSVTEMGTMPAGTLYWVSPDGGVMRASLAETGQAVEVARATMSRHTRPYQLRVEPETGGDGKPVGRAVLRTRYMYIGYGHERASGEGEPRQINVEIQLAEEHCRGFPADYWEQDRDLAKSVLDLRPVGSRRPEVKFDWYRHFLRSSRGTLSVGFANIQWQIQEPTVLPDGKVVFEWEEQVVIWDPSAGQLAWLAKGGCPTFVPEGK